MAYLLAPELWKKKISIFLEFCLEIPQQPSQCEITPWFSSDISPGG